MDEFHIPALAQKEQTDLAVVQERVRAWVGEYEPEKSGAIVQATDISLKILNLLITYVWTESQAAVRGVSCQLEAWQPAMVIRAAVPVMREKLAHRQGQESCDRNLNIKREDRHGEDQRQGLQCSAAEKSDLSQKQVAVASAQRHTPQTHRHHGAAPSDVIAVFGLVRFVGRQHQRSTWGRLCAGGQI